MNRLTILIVLLFSIRPLAAEVVDSSPHGFTSRNQAAVSATPEEVYGALTGDVGRWWSSAHTYSGDAANMSIDASQGGCFCEGLAGGGSVRHLEVVYADPGKALRLIGGLGPLQAIAATGAMTWQLTGTDTGTEITLTYAVGGYVPQGLDSWAAGVDYVVAEQLARLVSFIETGNPEQGAKASDTNDGQAE